MAMPVNLGAAQDKAENYEAPYGASKLALLALPNDKEIKVLIYEVEYRNDKVNSSVVTVEQEKKTKKEFIEKLDGAQWQEDTINYSYCDDSLLKSIEGNLSGWITTRPGVTVGNLDPPGLGESCRFGLARGVGQSLFAALFPKYCPSSESVRASPRPIAGARINATAAPTKPPTTKPVRMRQCRYRCCLP